MGQQLNIKSDEAYRLASELASLKGESLTDAVTIALRERLERESRERARRVAQVLHLAARIRESTPGGIMSNAELDAMLYDPETGLPR